MTDFRKLVAVSLLAGMIAGLLLSVLHHYQIRPLILAAELLEAPSHSHDWHPENGWQRGLFSVLFNGLTGFGFALLINTAMYWQGNNSYRYGLLWGLAGYAVFFVAPSLGLPPELPGTDSAALHSRQAWWLFTAVATAIGLYGVFLTKNRGLQIGGVILVALPHLIGAPHPEVVQALAPEALQQRFVWVSVISNALFWMTLGVLSSGLLRRTTL